MLLHGLLSCRATETERSLPLNTDYFSADSVQPIPAARCFYPPAWIFYYIYGYLHKTMLAFLNDISDYLIQLWKIVRIIAYDCAFYPRRGFRFLRRAQNFIPRGGLRASAKFCKIQNKKGGGMRGRTGTGAFS